MITKYKVELFDSDELVKCKTVTGYLVAWSICNDWIMTNNSHSFKISVLRGDEQ